MARYCIEVAPLTGSWYHRCRSHVDMLLMLDLVKKPDLELVAQASVIKDAWQMLID